MSFRPGAFGARGRALRMPLLVAVLLGLFYAPLLDPGAVLATRDMFEYHLPMRVAFAHLASSGLPQWDPFAHGGQPLLSNPNYAALYPLSWLVLLFSPALTINLLVLIHAAFAAWGALRLARRLGAGDGAALLAALAYACGPTFLSLLHTLTIALAMSFVPWALELTLALLDAPPEKRSRGAGFGLSLVLAAIFILGDPSIIAMTIIALTFFVAGRPAARLPRLSRLAGPLAVALGLGAIQLLPMLARLADSPRAGGVSWEQSTAWSLPWQRVAELFFPTFFGDSSRPELALYFGFGIHDQDFPYLLLIAVGLPLLLLSLASWTRRDAPERASWALITVAGVFLAFGRHNPLYRWAWSYLPGIDKLRFPEKFLLLALTAAIFSGALAWQRLLDQREPKAPGERGRALAAELPLALAALLAALGGGLSVLTYRAPHLISWFAREHSFLPLGGPSQQRALDFYRYESLVVLAFALGTCGLFALARFSRAPRRLLEGGAIALVALELWTYGHALVRTVPARAIFAPPRVASDLPSSAGRLFSDEPYQSAKTAIVFTTGNPRLLWARASIERLDSRAGNLFGHAYALDKDFDLSLTRPAVRALRFYEKIREHRELGLHLLGAWSVSHLVERKPTEKFVGEARAVGPELAPTIPPVRVRPNAFALPLYRFIAGARFFPDAAAAERAAVADELPLNAVEYLIAPSPVSTDPIAPLLEGRLDDARIRSVEDRGDRVRLAYTAPRPALLVAASTFDSRWRAHAGESALPIFETAAGYMALLVPAGEHEVTLRFRDPWVTVGAAVTATTILLALGLAMRPRRARATPIAPDP